MIFQPPIPPKYYDRADGEMTAAITVSRRPAKTAR